MYDGGGDAVEAKLRLHTTAEVHYFPITRHPGWFIPLIPATNKDYI